MGANPAAGAAEGNDYRVPWGIAESKSKSPNSDRYESMGKHDPNHRRIKIHRTYTVEEFARLFPVHKNTVRNGSRLDCPPSTENGRR
jgi:hypothetical protein